jgi:AcrR family transcriptional regulator
MNRVVDNRQARKTCAALHQAFRELFLTRGYDSIRVADILRRADVGRSTFYEHFRNKDDLFRQSVAPIATVLASAVAEDNDPKAITHVLEHFREIGRIARNFLNSPSYRQIVGVVAELIEQRVGSSNEHAGIPRSLFALQLAEAEMGMIRAWLADGAACPASTMTGLLKRGMRSLCRALSNR